jgi:hypothetical protein
MIRVPQLGSNKDVFAGNASGDESGLQRLTHLAFVPVTFRTVEVPESGFQRIPDSIDRLSRIRDERAKPEQGHMKGVIYRSHVIAICWLLRRLQAILSLPTQRSEAKPRRCVIYITFGND